MSIKPRLSTIVVIIAAFFQINLTWAQTPSSILGDGCLQGIISGSYPLAGYGYSLFLPANTGNTYQLIGIYNVTSSSGTYSYTPTSSSAATVGVNDSLGGIGNIYIKFTTTNAGTFNTVVNAYPSASQSGQFSFASYNAPSFIAGKTLVCSIVSGLYPFYNSGSYTINFASSGNTYTTSSGDSGTYAYSLANRSTGKLQMASSLFGSFVGYFGYTDALHGGFAANQASTGGYQVGNFTQLDTTLPTLTITAPTATQRWSNSVFTVTGTAGDDTQVSAVYYQIFGQGWNLATTSNGWTNWSGNISLSAIGTNVIQAYSVDTSGNTSPISSQSLVYVVTAVATVQTNGYGSISPNYNGQLLEIAKSYSMTATPSPGFAFVNWTGSVATNNVMVQFMMSSNLTLTANFADVTKPTNIITSPTAGQLWSNQVFTVRGTASDNVAVTNVIYKLNAGGWIPALTTNGWTNWQATLTLQPSNNVVQAYAVDSSGNLSATNSVSLSYIVSDTLRVQIIGQGTIAPNYSNAVLQIGKSYSMTATPSAGFTLTNWMVSTNWVGGVISNNATLGFVMQSNLTIQATFADTVNPTNTIIAPTSGQRWSNAVITATGTAADNVQVSNVWYRVNGFGWNPATTGNNWSNWTAQIALTPGTNAIAVYCTDINGNPSLTNSLSIQYVVTNQLQVAMTGMGTNSPNYNNAWLEVGRYYSMTSSPAAGFVFSNWTSSQGWSSNSAVVTFMMASNLSLTSSFRDTNSPTLSITNLVGGQRWTNFLFTVRGVATDNWQVASVQYQFNGLGWSNATGTTNWSVPLTLPPGTNTFAVYAADNSGNISTTSSVSFQYVVTNQLGVRTVGLGTVSPNYSNAWLEVGRNYSITSAPAAGFVFTNWIVSTNWISGATAIGTNLQIMMQSNLTLQANFLDVTKPTLTLTSPTNSQKMTNALVIGLGTASDNWQVSNVWYQLNSGTWSMAGTTNGYTNWATPMLPLLIGTNLLKAYAIDLGGNLSTTSSVSFISSNTFALKLVMTNSLLIKTNGLVFNLQLSANLNGHIQVSTNLTDWASLTNFVGSNSSITFRDPGASNSSKRFYRAVVP